MFYFYYTSGFQFVTKNLSLFHYVYPSDSEDHLIWDSGIIL